MIVPDALIELQLRNAANALEAVAADARIIPQAAKQMNLIAKAVRDTANLVGGLPPFAPD